ncbi:hypothetical protein HOK51_07930 [Candidatus Woesearchaeota archaeon]|jgi:hypothetical protein|nr:hypothetical protein [Candidatus Woesearchaeota archaeon]MBT6519754.1 hypothetical protein [Candidatus Woesearchaeota archaeon]MBT7368134.1 hypothetical protein [Candidatus Woesearchaeota archaeon]
MIQQLEKKYANKMTQQNNLSLKKLKGIKPNGVKHKLEEPIQRIFDDCDNYIKENHGAVIYESNPECECNKLSLERKLFLEEVGLDKKLLELFIVAKSDFDGDKSSKRLVGVYSGLLLTYLSQYNKANNKSTNFYFEGDEITFDHLFAGSYGYNGLIINNFQGDCICDNVGHGADSTFLAGFNIFGDRLFHFSKSKMYLVKNCEGNFIFHHAANVSKDLDLMIADNIFGDNLLENISDETNLKLVIARNIEGYNALRCQAFTNGKINLILAENIQGDCSLGRSENAEILDGAVGKIGLVLCNDIVGRINMHSTNERTVVRGKLEPNIFNQNYKKYKLDKLNQLVDKIETVNESTFNNLKEIYKVYNSIKSEIEKIRQ